jgi:transposase
VDFVHEGYYTLWLMSIVEQLEASGEVLSPAIRGAIELLERTVAELRERIQELEARLAQNSTNSSKPPSSDPPGVVRPGKKPKGRKRGGQRGHHGSHRVLLPPDRIDQVVQHAPDSCEHCGHSLAGAEEGLPAHVHQVVELPPVRAEVKEHRMLCLRCPRCSGVTRAPLPREVGGKHFGPRLTAFVAVLAGHYRMSRRSVTDLASRLLDVPPPSLGSTEACTQEASAALEAAYEELRAEVKASRWAGVDETPWKLRGGKMWLWVATAKNATVFRMAHGRGKDELEKLLEKFEGIVSSDRWCAYQTYGKRQLCWAHLARNFKKLGLRGGKAAEFAAEAGKVCDRVFERWRCFREGTLERDGLKRRMARIRTSFRRLAERGAESINQKVAGMCRNLLKLWPSLWTFLDEPIELTNNAAERALRKAVLWRKNCFGNQSESGLRYAERILSVSATCQQQQVHPFDFVARSIAALRAGSEKPKLLPQAT